MKYGARNQIVGTVDVSVPAVMVDVSVPAVMESVMTLDSLEELGLKEGDKVKVIVKAVSVLLVKE